MTREQAIKLVVAATNSAPDYPLVPFLVDALDGLGILKLANPHRNLNGELCEKLGWPVGGAANHHLVHALDAAGLKIVEK